MTSIPEIAVPFTNRVPRVMPVLDDTMEPTIRRGDFLFVVPVDKFEYDSIYVVNSCGCHRTYRVTSFGKRAILKPDNPGYQTVETTREEFNSSVDGLVIAYLKVIDGRYFRV